MWRHDAAQCGLNSPGCDFQWQNYLRPKYNYPGNAKINLVLITGSRNSYLKDIGINVCYNWKIRWYTNQKIVINIHKNKSERLNWRHYSKPAPERPQCGVRTMSSVVLLLDWDEAKSVKNWVPNGLLPIPQMIYEWIWSSDGKIWWNYVESETDWPGREPGPRR